MRRFWNRAALLFRQFEGFWLIEYVQVLRAMKTIQRRPMIEARLQGDSFADDGRSRVAAFDEKDRAPIVWHKIGD